MRRIFITIFLVSLISCNKPRPISNVSFSFNETANKFSNGFILFGKSLDGRSFLKKVPPQNLKLDFNNDTWSFFAIGWEKVSSDQLGNFEGKAYCGKIEKVKLQGDDYNFKIVMSNSDCNNQDFTYSPSVSSNKDVHFPNRDFIICRNIYEINNFGETSKCDKQVKNRGYATFLKISLPEFQNNNGEKTFIGKSLESRCVAIDSMSGFGQSISTSNEKFISPLTLSLPDSNEAGIEYKINLYYTDEGCVTQKIVQDEDAVELPLTGTPRTKAFASTRELVQNDSQSTVRVFIAANEQQVCKGSRVTTRFGGGMGTPNSPYLMCTPAQLNSFTTHPEEFKDKSFETSGQLMYQF
ncbi:MAG: hypothetical protein H7281_11470 [Bacteriovorax sp.]|nr:hypothetical protein [Bacteriovorax sp.]